MAFGASEDAGPADGGPFFYRGLTYGSESNVGPLDVLLNKGFDLAQVGNRGRRIFDYPYATSHVTDALLHPVEAIDRIGSRILAQPCSSTLLHSVS